MSVARFAVRGKLDGAGGDRTGTLTIDRDTGEVTVRPKGSHRTYTTMLGSLATMVCIAELRSVVKEEGR
jgi:hypothetical protein